MRDIIKFCECEMPAATAASKVPNLTLLGPLQT